MPPRLTDHQRRLRTITEAAWQKKVQDLLTLYGWKWYHAPNNRPGKGGHVQNIKAGYPDITAARGKRSLYAELKTETGRTTPEQDEWLEAMAEAGHETYVWRPRDIDEVITILSSQWKNEKVA
ncbi:nuclease [Arthrobacter phage Edmundo]|nr:nuclease [Arthrobacter phage Edmundo]